MMFEKRLNNSILDELRKIEVYFENEHLLSFLTKYEELLAKKGNNIHYSYWGINFKNEKVYSLKFYAHIIDEITQKEILDFVPNSNDFEQYSHMKNGGVKFDVNNVGTALELKFIIGHSEPRYGFFYMLKDSALAIDLLGFPKSLPVDFVSKCISAGVNFEYEGNKKVFKKYYYFNPSDCKSYFEKKFNVSILQNSSLIEYSESDGFSKINIFGAEVLSSKSPKGNFTENEKEIINYFNNKYDFVNLEYGLYDHGEIKSVYFFSPSIKTGFTSESMGALKRLIYD